MDEIENKNVSSFESNLV